MRKILLQMFAEESEQAQPTNDVENNPQDSGVSQEQDDVHFDDNKTGQQETSNDTKTQSRINFENAQKRIMAKQQKELEKAQLEKAQKESYVKGVIESNNGKNPITGKPMVDQYDVNQLKIFQEMQQQGIDITDAGEIALYLARKEREAETQKQLELQKQRDLETEMDKDLSDFTTMYNQQTLNDLFNEELNPMFKNRFGKYVGKIPLTELYQDYLDFKNEINKKAETLALEKDARRTSQSGSQLSDSKPTIKSYGEMTPEERKAYRDSRR